MPPILSEVLAASNTTRDSFNGWKKRNLLREEVPETRPGVARQMTRGAALEVAFMSALTRAGFEPADASVVASEWLNADRAGTLGAVFLLNTTTGTGRLLPEYILNEPADALLTVLDLSDTTEGRIIPDGEPLYDRDRDAPKPATGLNIIYVAEIVRRIDALFSEQP
jgi:hypothetical protein